MNHMNGHKKNLGYHIKLLTDHLLQSIKNLRLYNELTVAKD